ncbi:MAG TPA: hypothetical protein PKK74_10335 [Candidatus Methanoculleus thermohydrogenotrophicum]|nr:hypothetical protein [Candidatus Methanoculleus thermohydrogenotrophicum]
MFSIDFLVGFTIFMVALIAVASMVPGLLAGLQSSGIDYDAVAYRTGVILTEDPGWPGWPVYPPWEMKDQYHKDEIERMGLAVSNETPNILLSTKIEKFFNDTFFTTDDYRSKAIFGEIPYSYNITLRSLDGRYNHKVGQETPEGYGYIRRVVKIKEPSVAVIDGSLKERYTISPGDNSTTRTFTVRLDFSRLLNASIDPAYRIDPRTEPVNITITNFSEYLNKTDETVKNATLKSVTFRRGSSSIRFPFPYDTENPDLYTLSLDGNPYDLKPEAPVESNISLVLKPPATSLFPLDQNSILDIRFTFENDPPHTNITGIHYYDYNPKNVTRPALKPAVLEVAIW